MKSIIVIAFLIMAANLFALPMLEHELIAGGLYAGIDVGNRAVFTKTAFISPGFFLDLFFSHAKVKSYDITSAGMDIYFRKRVAKKFGMPFLSFAVSNSELIKSSLIAFNYSIKAMNSDVYLYPQFTFGAQFTDYKDSDSEGYKKNEEKRNSNDAVLPFMVGISGHFGVKRQNHFLDFNPGIIYYNEKIYFAAEIGVGFFK